MVEDDSEILFESLWGSMSREELINYARYSKGEGELWAVGIHLGRLRYYRRLYDLQGGRCLIFNMYLVIQLFTWGDSTVRRHVHYL